MTSSPRWRRCTPARWSSATPPPRARTASGLDWPGRGEGLTDRESEILALITQGMSNADVAALTYLSPNTVKSYIRTSTARSASPAAPKRCCGGCRQRLRPKKNAASSSRNASSHPFVMVVGRSGSGKSSLVYAGLLPALRRERDRFWTVLTLRPGPTPLRALAAAFNSRTENEGAAE